MSQKRSLVQENYKDYIPQVNVKKTVQILLNYVPPEDLAHLQFIVLTNTAALSRARKRQRRSSGAPLSRVMGRCYQRWKGQPAYIELYVDNILKDVSWYDLRLPMFRNWMFAKILYHEIGHHVQVLSNAKLVKEEVFAEKYAASLKKSFSRQRYGYLRFLLPLIKVCLGFIRIIEIELVKKRLVRKK